MAQAPYSVQPSACSLYRSESAAENRRPNRILSAEKPTLHAAKVIDIAAIPVGRNRVDKVLAPPAQFDPFTIT
jgi:hypothetical protein